MSTVLTKLKTKRVIILDPEFKAREILRRFIETFPGVEVNGCFDRPWKVVKYAKTLQPGWIFIDIELVKEMKGIIWLQKLATFTKIILTAYYFDPLIEELQKYSAGCLFKPVDIEELKEIIMSKKLYYETDESN
jgi:DNA-binding LytR/AlgR family response regulator